LSLSSIPNRGLKKQWFRAVWGYFQLQGVEIPAGKGFLGRDWGTKKAHPERMRFVF
jgi:hypothetical protein